MENEKASSLLWRSLTMNFLTGYSGALGPFLLFLDAPIRLPHGLAKHCVWHKLALGGHLTHLCFGIGPSKNSEVRLRVSAASCHHVTPVNSGKE